MIGAGSIAVRRSIERHQPLAGLHGHIHRVERDCEDREDDVLQPWERLWQRAAQRCPHGRGDAIRTSLLTAG